MSIDHPELAALIDGARHLVEQRRRAIDIFLNGANSAQDSIELDDMQVLVSAGADLDTILPASPDERVQLAAALRARFGDQLDAAPELTALLGSGPPGEPSTATPPESLDHAFDRVLLPAGTTLFTDGDHADSVYVITQGRLRVVSGDGETLLAELGPGQTVGEMALLTGDKRQGTVSAIRDAVLYRLERQDFDRFCIAHPNAMHHMLVSLAHRVNAPTQRIQRRAVPTTIAVVPAGQDATAAASAFAVELTRFLAVHRSARLVSAETVAAAVGSSALTDTSVAEHLAALEADHDHLVLATDDDRRSPWAERSLRQADRILVVGRADAHERPNELEAWIAGAGAESLHAGSELVLIEPHGDRTPTRTARWFAGRSVDAVHHVHPGMASHIARLCRFLVGEPFALVLSGGASRALAHIGVLRALREVGYPVDVVVGTSAGALVGGQYAMGWNPELIAQRNATIFGGSKRKLLDFTPPFTSLIGSAGFNAALDEVFGDVAFEDLWIRFACTTTDLTSAASRTHQRGRLRQFVRASCSLPMVMPPVPLDGHLLADGGIMNNVPVNPLLELTDVGALVVVNVTNPFYAANEDYNYDDSLAFRRVLNSRLNPWAEKLVAPGIFDILMRSLEIGSKSLEPQQIAKADVYIRPDVSDFGYTDVERIDEIIEAGYVAAAEALADWDLPVIPFQ